MYNVHPRFRPSFQGKKIFAYRYLFFVLERNFSIYFWTCYGTSNFMERILQNTRTDTCYFRYYPCIMHSLIFPWKMWTTKCAWYMANYWVHKTLHQEFENLCIVSLPALLQTGCLSLPSSITHVFKRYFLLVFALYHGDWLGFAFQTTLCLTFYFE